MLRAKILARKYDHEDHNSNNDYGNGHYLGVNDSSQLEPISLSPEAGGSSILTTNNACRRIRVDFVLVANGQEVGCGEIKPPGTTSQLVEEDRARTSELLKRQLHVRFMKSKDPKQFVTFDAVFNGFNIELYVMAFDFENTPSLSIL
ncbi:hypothetical protein CU098_007197 [Rhizopus stolonifer]|uniref:Uncharacterized protein n=1 Tax=Rhizopus stolonifer TaxID=4846 RepID=A0A367IWZ7_RHIST|nr:hypothetical protein CU098_007197 [Rhizopus stolonifer]